MLARLSALQRSSMCSGLHDVLLNVLSVPDVIQVTNWRTMTWIGRVMVGRN